MPPRYPDYDEDEEILDDEDDECEEPEDEEDEDEEEPEDEEDEEEVFHRIEQGYRSERVRIRTCDDLGELRQMRRDYQELEAGRNLNQASRIRARDLIELIDDRITDIKAGRLSPRRH